MATSFPALDEYNAAVQAPHVAFQDAGLRRGTVSKNQLGLPNALGGGFAITYKVTADGRKYAVRCFHRSVPDIERRYQLISQSLRNLPGNLFVDFEFQRTGIRVGRDLYPIVKMGWVEGETLGSFLEANYDRPASIELLRKSFETAESFLGSHGIAHGDLQNGNAIITNGQLRLIDYDGMFVPGMPPGQGGELGHRHFQHPMRSSKDFGPSMDRFSFIVIDFSLEVLRKRSDYFDRYSTGENILFSANDFADPDSSPIFRELAADAEFSVKAGNLASICAARVDHVPSLTDFRAGRGIPARTTSVAQGTATSARAAVRSDYLSPYPVLNATDYNAALRCIGDRVEAIGQIVEVNLSRTRKGGRPYVFINFGPWQGNIFKVAIWSTGLSALRSTPDTSWRGKWISVTGIVDPVYASEKYGYRHVSITVNDSSQLRILPDSEARYRLAGQRSPAGPSAVPQTSNSRVLDEIRGRRSEVESVTPSASSPSPHFARPRSNAASGQTAQSRNQAILRQIGTPNQVSGEGRPAAGQHLRQHQISQSTQSPQKPSSTQQTTGIPAWFWWLMAFLILILIASQGK